MQVAAHNPIVLCIFVVTRAFSSFFANNANHVTDKSLSPCHVLELTVKETTTTPQEEPTPPAAVATITPTRMDLIITQMTMAAHTTTMEAVVPLTPPQADSLVLTPPPSK